MITKTASYEPLNELYDHFTLTIEKIKKLSEMTSDNEAVVLMAIIEDILSADLGRADAIMERAGNQKMTA